MKAQLVVLALAIIVAVPGCRREDTGDQRTDSVTPEDVARARADWPAGVAEQVDSGNTAYSARDYETALRHYRRASELAPDIVAPWWGIYMAESERGNVAAAESAMARARALAPGASLIHPTAADTQTTTTGHVP